MKSVKINFHKNLFEQLRVVIINEEGRLTNENLVKAITLNENLDVLGLSFSPKDIIRIASSSNIDTLYNEIKSFVPDIVAKPMYPDFPSQVMEMDEAVYRFHQMLHYMSTYGIENFLGVNVSKGWLPEVTSTEKTQIDDSLLEKKVLEAATEKEALNIINEKIIKKAERFTLPEKELAFYVANTNLEIINDVPFKENISILCNEYIAEDAKMGYLVVRKFCKHPGDVFKVLKDYLKYTKYKNLPTSRKRMFVKILESYTPESLYENIYPSYSVFNTKIVNLLERISYSRFSKSEEHMKIVKMARNKEIQTWHSKLEKMIINNENDKALKLAEQRPGVLFRMARRFVRLGFDKVELKKALLRHSDNYKIQSIISTLNKLKEDNDESVFMIDACISILKQRLTTIVTPLKGKKIFIEEGNYSFANSVIELNDKSQSGGYVRSGLAFKIPDDVANVRFFTYWNDKKRIDIDLHAMMQFRDAHKEYVGWNSHYNKYGVVHSGDITHSDAAEYIDMNLEAAHKAEIEYVMFNIRSFTRVPFNDIDTVFCGLMGVSKNGTDKKMKLNSIKNEFIRHDLKVDLIEMFYGYVDVANKVLVVNAKKGDYVNDTIAADYSFTVSDYIDILIESQNIEVVSDRDEADYIVRLDKDEQENSISLIDENYFLDYQIENEKELK